MTWSDSLLWSIRPDCAPEARALLERFAAESRGMHRDSLLEDYHARVSKYLDMDPLPIDMHGDRVAVVSVVGPCVNEVTPFAASYPLLTKAFRQLETDNNIAAVVVRFKTPGGTVSGLAECAAALDALSDTKLTIAQNDGGCYSAGYFLACHCGEIYSPAADQIGNIGTVISLDDFSAMFQKQGIRTITKRTGEIKGLGIFGDPITDAQEQFLQHLVDAHFMDFAAAVRTGRGMDDTQFAAVSDGRWWLGREAIDLNIIDRVSTLRETLAAIDTMTGT